MSNALGGASILPSLFALVSSNIAGDSWQGRVASLVAICASAEGAHAEFKPALPQIMPHILACLENPHPRVCFAACNCIGQLAIDFAPEEGKSYRSSLQGQFHAEVIPRLLAVAQRSHQPRVQAHGVSALINFTEQCTRSTLGPYLDQVLSLLGSLLSSPHRFVQEQTIVCIATVADSAQHLFRKYYSVFMPALHNVLRYTLTVPDNSARDLRDKTMECVSLVAVAVGKQLFLGDAGATLDLLAEAQKRIPSDDNSTSFVSAHLRSFLHGEGYTLPY